MEIFIEKKEGKGKKLHIFSNKRPRGHIAHLSHIG
jgi:hypothetical protein